MTFRAMRFGGYTLRRANFLRATSFNMPATSTVVISRREFFGKKEDEEKKTENKAAENAEEQPQITLEEAVEQINALESQLSEAKAAREKEEKDFKYRLSEIAQEMKSQKTRLDREAEKAKKNEDLFDTQLHALLLDIESTKQRLRESQQKRGRIESELINLLETNAYFRSNLHKMHSEQLGNLKNLSGSIRRTAVDAGYYQMQYKNAVPKLNERKRMNEQLMDKYRAVERQHRMYQLHVESK